MDALFSWLCHRMADRCLPGLSFLCARCLGLYLGALVGAVCLGAARLASWGRPGRTALWILGAAAAATPVQVLLERIGAVPGSNALRLALGLALGTSLAVAMGAGWLRPSAQGPSAAWLLIPAMLDLLCFGVVFSSNRWEGISAAVFRTAAAAGWAALTAGLLSVCARRIRSSPRKT